MILGDNYRPTIQENVTYSIHLDSSLLKHSDIQTFARELQSFMGAVTHYENMSGNK